MKRAAARSRLFNQLAPVVLAVPLVSSEPGARIAAAQARPASTDSLEQPVRWPDTTFSPRPVRPANLTERALSQRCAVVDGALAAVAQRLARGEIAADPQALARALRQAGAPYVWPRAWSLSGRVDIEDAKSRFDDWLASRPAAGQRRCGFARIDGESRTVVTAVAVDVEADLAPISIRVRPGAWIDFTAPLLVPASTAKVVVALPEGSPYNAPTSLTNGRARARIHLDRRGAFRLSLVIGGPSGPHPALEIDLFAGVEPAIAETAAPGESTGGEGDPATALARMIAAARDGAGLSALQRDAALDRLARAHAERMMRSARLGHDAGDGDPAERLLGAGVAARELGENVAHAASAVLAHRALWDSPSHRENMLADRFDRIGVGVSEDPDGSLWVTEIFVRQPPGQRSRER